MSGLPADDGVMFATTPSGGRRRRARGGAGDQVEEIKVDTPSVVEEVPIVKEMKPEAKESLRSAAVSILANARKAVYDVLGSQKLKDVLIAGVTIAAVAGVIQQVNQQYEGQFCSVPQEALAATLKSVGFGGRDTLCRATREAYMETINTIKTVSAPLIAAAVGRVAGVKLSLGEGLVTTVMNTLASSITKREPPLPPAEETATGEEAATGAEEVRPPKKQKIRGGRTRRRGPKKGGKSRKSRR